MRTSFVVVLICGVALTAGVLGLLKLPTTTRTPAPVTEPVVRDETISPVARTTPNEARGQSTPQTSIGPTETLSPTPTSPEPVVETHIEPPPEPPPFSEAIDTLVSPETSFKEKQAALGRLQASGQLDAAIGELKRGAAEHPTSAAYPAALGQAQLRKAGEVADAGGKVSEMGILGMRADQNFDAALELDPTHWEAQFFKAAAMSYWPLELGRGEEVIQRFSSLIDQQDSMVPQPEFAQTYVMLGDEYLKMDQPDYARATWEIGAQKFPGNPLLRKRLSGQ